MIISEKDYVTGVFRGEGGGNQVTHLYLGTFDDPGFPMCSRGWQRRYYEDGKLVDFEYSIFRNNISKKGICKVCLRRAVAGLPPIIKPNESTRT